MTEMELTPQQEILLKEMRVVMLSSIKRFQKDGALTKRVLRHLLFLNAYKEAMEHPERTNIVN